MFYYIKKYEKFNFYKNLERPKDLLREINKIVKVETTGKKSEKNNE